MPIEVLMPSASPTMEKGNISKWIKKEGDEVKFGDVILEIETDKATMEVESNDDGILGKIVQGDGSADIPVGDIIGYIKKESESDEEFNSAIKSSTSNSSAQNSAQNQEEKKVPESSNSAKNEPEPKFSTSDKTIVNEPISDSSRIKISPLAKKISQNENFDYKNLQGTGPGGRIVKKDIDLAMKKLSTHDLVEINQNQILDDLKIPNSSMRNAIAKRLSDSKHQSPHFYLSIECDITKLLEIREKMNTKAKKDENGKPEYKISVNDFIVMSSSKALVDYPKIKTTFYPDHILQYGSTDISIAMSIEDGLITPIVKNANSKTLISISKEIKSLAKKAKTNSLKPNEFSGGSFTISNLGMFNIDSFFAIINPPQSAILSVGVNKKKPVFCNKKNDFIPRDVISLSLSVDHRSIDGVYAAQFLNQLKSYLENVEYMLL